MRLTLSSRNMEFEMEVPIRAEAVEALKHQLGRLQGDEEHYRAITTHLGRLIAIEFGRVIDWDLCKPTKRQVNLARRMMRVLAVGIPAEALLYRSVMDKFLERHRGEYLIRRRKRG